MIDTIIQMIIEPKAIVVDLDDDMTMYKIPEDNVDESYVRFSLDMTDHTYYYVRSSEIGDSRPRA